MLVKELGKQELDTELVGLKAEVYTRNIREIFSSLEQYIGM